MTASLLRALDGVDDVIRRSLAKRRGMYDAADFEDLRSEVMLRLVRRLEDRNAEPVANLGAYAAIVTYHVVDDYVRRRYPDRARLTNRVRFTLTRDPRFALWEIDGDFVGGFREWMERRALSASALSPRRAESPSLHEQLSELFLETGGPLLLQSIVAALWEKPSALERVPEPIAPAEPEPVEVTRLWTEIRALPLRQRCALLLNLRDDNGENALIHLGVSHAELASALEMRERRFAQLWPELPLDDNRIGALIGATRQQVINLRKCARERLVRRRARW